MLPHPLLIGNEIYRGSTYGTRHPLAIPRVSTTLDLIRALGWVGNEAYVESRPATPDELARFHDRDYIEAVMEAERTQRVAPDAARRFNIGCNGNPLFREVFSRPATTCGATLMAVDLLQGGGIVHSVAGGTHHGRADRASGFCYFNDPVLGILRLLDTGYERIAYVDFDAHHCDGVADALAGERRVLVASVHEAGRWPNTGPLEEDGGGNIVNLPVPPGFNDSEMALLVDEVLAPLVEGFAPEILILQCGADALAEDPLSKLELSNNAIWRAVARLRPLAPRILAMGGGGYNPWSVARCWTGLWATLNDIPIPAALPLGAETVLRGIAWSRSQGRNPPEHWFTTLADAPHEGPVRPVIRALAEHHRRRAGWLPIALAQAV
jgi:acetoin utilization protein AcuC